MKGRNEAKEFLRQIEKLDIQIKNKLKEKEQWRDVALNITANMSGDRVQSSGSKSRMENAVVKYVDCENEANDLLDRLIEARKEVIQTIEQVESPFYYDLLHRRYVQHKTLEAIAAEMDKSYTAITTAHGRALIEVEKIIAKEKGKR